MAAWVATILTGWCCVLIATPRKPRLGNEVEELVYTRLLGRRRLLIGFAATMTAATGLVVVVTLPQRIDPTLGEARRVDQYCAAAAAGQPSCYRLASDGRWLAAARQSDGHWADVGTVPAPPMGDTATAAQRICADAPDRDPVCYTPQSDGSWAVETRRADGGWERSVTRTGPPSLDELQRAYSG